MTTLFSSKLVLIALAGTIAIGAGAYIYDKTTAPQTITTTVHDVQQVKVEVPVLTEKIVDRIITDPKQQAAISKLIKENNDLKLKLIQVSSTVATNNTSGGTATQGVLDNPLAGTITPDQIPLPTVGVAVPSFTYKDWQLEANYSKSRFTYDLSQTFIIESTTGKDSEGNPIGITRLFQDSPTGLISIPAKTTVIQADETVPHWFVSPRIQGGVSIGLDKVYGGVAGLQLFKYGRSKDPKDILFSVGTIGVAFRTNDVQPVLLPISLNLGHIRNQPFSNLWISPSVDKSHRVGIVLSATF